MKTSNIKKIDFVIIPIAVLSIIAYFTVSHKIGLIGVISCIACSLILDVADKEAVLYRKSVKFFILKIILLVCLGILLLGTLIE